MHVAMGSAPAAHASVTRAPVPRAPAADVPVPRVTVAHASATHTPVPRAPLALAPAVRAPAAVTLTAAIRAGIRAASPVIFHTLQSHGPARVQVVESGWKRGPLAHPLCPGPVLTVCSPATLAGDRF